MQIQGFTTANIAEVETATKALRVTPRPADVLGSYALSANSGIMAAALSVWVPIFEFRWSSAKTCLVRWVSMSAGNDGTAFAVGTMFFGLHMCRSWTLNDTGGTSITPAAGKNKLRTSMADSVVADCRIATTAGLSPTTGGKIVEGDSLAQLAFGVTATAGAPMLPPRDFFDYGPGEYPLVLQQNEGFIIQSLLTPATGTWKFAVNVNWDEVSAYP